MTENDELFDFTPELDSNDIQLVVEPDEGDEDEDIDEEYSAPTVANTEAPEVVPVKVDNRTPQQKTADLLTCMASHRKTLVGIMRLCATPTTVEEVEELVEDLRTQHTSVFSAAVFCRQLEDAGAIELVDAEGNPFVEGENEPEIVIVDGVECFAPVEAPTPYWSLTEAGKDVLAGIDPLAAARQLLADDDETMIPVFKRVLEECSREGGITTPELNTIIDALPQLQSPRRYTARFTSRLLDVDALDFKETWKITEYGKQLLAEL